MKKALISPNETIPCISEWTVVDNKPYAISSTIPNGQRIVAVVDQPFDVAAPLFWANCGDFTTMDDWYYDAETKTVVEIPLPPAPPVIAAPITDLPESK